MSGFILWFGLTVWMCTQVVSATSLCGNVTTDCEREVYGNRTRRQVVLRPIQTVQRPQTSNQLNINDYDWPAIYKFTVKLARVMANRPLMQKVSSLVDSSLHKRGYLTKQALYGFGFGGLGFYRPLFYYTPIYTTFPAYSYYPLYPIYTTTGGAANTISNTALIDALIQLIQEAIDNTYDYYNNGGTPAP